MVEAGRTPPLLELSRLSIGIRGGNALLSAVDGISFELGSGEILGLVGESGCGKSLTCLSILRLLPSQALIAGGAIRFNGRDMRALSEEELRRVRGNEISMVFQEPLGSLNPLMKVGRQIPEALELHGQRDKRFLRAQTLEIMERLGLPEPERLIRAYPHQLSGGMRQRAAIAMAAVCRPRLLIADEPAAALDSESQEQILSLIRRIHGELGAAALFVSHDLDLVRRLCHRALVMYAGKILEEGSAQEVFTNPLHPYTRLLIGSIPRREHKGRPLAVIPGKAPSIEEKEPGCPFAPRCAEALEECRAAFPEKTVFPENHAVYCRRARPARAAGEGEG